MIRCDQPGSKPVRIPEQIPNPAVVPKKTPVPAPSRPVKVPEKIPVHH